MMTLSACAAALALLCASPALATPTIVSTQVTGSALSEEGQTISVIAEDPDAAVNAVRVAPTLSGLHEVAITVVSGACGDQERTVSVTLPIDVAVPGLPAARDPALPPLLPLPPLPSLKPLARTAATCPGADLMPDATNLARVRAALRAWSTRSARRAGCRACAATATCAGRRRATPRTWSPATTSTTSTRRARASASRLKQVHYWPATASENIGAADGVFATPATMVDAWMHSSAHRTNILTTKFRQVGFGIIPSTPQGGSGATYTADFGRR